MNVETAIMEWIGRYPIWLTAQRDLNELEQKIMDYENNAGILS